jgi:hypothetical protein
MHEHCHICVELRGQLDDLESRIGAILDRRERPSDSKPREQDSRHRLNELIKAAAQIQDQCDRHQCTAHARSATA